MTILKNPRLEKFVHNVIKGMGHGPAWTAAGFKATGNVAESAASRAFKRDNVKARYDELMKGLEPPPEPIGKRRQSAANVSALLGSGNRPVGSRDVMRVTRWIQLHTEPEDAVLFLPNNAAYYYLSGRRNPIRFAMGHQIVTEAHRVEVLEDLRDDPPRYIVWDQDAVRVDALPDRLVFGTALLGWIHERYETQLQLGAVEILRPRASSGGDR